MINQIEKILSLLVTAVLLFSAGCSDPKEEYSPLEQDVDNNGQTNNGDPDDAGQDDVDDTGQDGASRPTQAECDAASNEQQCLEMGCAIWVEVDDLSNSTGDTAESCLGQPRIHLCISDPGALEGGATPSVQYRQTDSGYQVIWYPALSFFEGFTVCSNDVPQPPEPPGCGCHEFFD